jgi:hypothetical protein
MSASRYEDITTTEEHHMSRIHTLLTGAAVTAALTLGGAGLAGATTPSGTGSTPTPAICARAAKVEARIEKRETKAAAYVPKAQAREAKATAANHPKRAAAIGRRIAFVQKWEARGETRLSKIEAKCAGTTGSASTSAPTGSVS